MVESRARTLGSSISAASTNPSAATLTAVREDLRAFGAAVNGLSDAVGGSC